MPLTCVENISLCIINKNINSLQSSTERKKMPFRYTMSFNKKNKNLFLREQNSEVCRPSRIWNNAKRSMKYLPT